MGRSAEIRANRLLTSPATRGPCAESPRAVCEHCGPWAGSPRAVCGVPAGRMPCLRQPVTTRATATYCTRYAAMVKAWNSSWKPNHPGLGLGLLRA